VQVEQLVAVHPLQEDEAALDLTVCPWPPLLEKLQADMSLLTLSPLHDGQFGCSLPKTRDSKQLLQSSH
jgi:hypothetical protein